VAKASALPPEDDSPYGRFARGSILSHRDWLKANLQRQSMREAWERFFTEFDVLLCPATIVPAILHTQEKGITDRTISVNGVSRPYLDLFSWAGVIGVSYLPATAAPVGKTESGLPAGLQIVSGYLEDATSIDFSARLSRVLGGFSPPPAFKD
jgi:amidase